MPPRQSQRLNHTGYLSTGKYTPHTSTTIVDEVLTARANKLLHWGRDGEDCSLPVDRGEIVRTRSCSCPHLCCKFYDKVFWGQTVCETVHLCGCVCTRVSKNLIVGGKERAGALCGGLVEK